jgi:hypothetical protein
MFTWGNLKERGHEEDWGVNGRVVLKRNLNKMSGSI